MRWPDPMRWPDAGRMPPVMRTAVRRRLVRVAAAAGVIAATVAAGLSSAAIALAASPSPSDAISGDPRSSGQGPGLVGNPAAAILLVVIVAALAIGLTLLYVRATGGPGSRTAR